MVRTRVGYAGGMKENPTYHDLDGHSETIQIDYDPTQISYKELLEVFWDSHNPTFQQLSRQYMSIVFYHDDEQKRMATESKERQESKLGRKIFTEIVSFSSFYLAEDYHQKYFLQQEPKLMKEFNAIYPYTADFVNSTAAARVNGYVGGYGNSGTLMEQIENLGLSDNGKQILLEIAKMELTPGCTVRLLEQI